MFDILEMIKTAALEAIEHSKPVNIVYGTVVNDEPLSIKIDQKQILSSEHLIISRNFTDYKIRVSAPNPIGNTELTVYNKLKKGEKVILLRKQGGQQYLILERL